ncbi:hypothetical protein Tco_1482525 [Tanacetum coccineum]
MLQTSYEVSSTLKASMVKYENPQLAGRSVPIDISITLGNSPYSFKTLVPKESWLSGGNQRGQSSSDRSLSGTKGGMTLQCVSDLCISLCTQIGRKEILEVKLDAKGVYSGEDKKWSECQRKRDTEDAVSTDKDKDIPEAEKKFKQLARDEVMARKLQEDWETEEKRKRLAEEEATKTALSDEYDFIQARIEADRLLALRLQDEERESSSLNKPPIRTQLRNKMMTYLKHVGNKKHSDLNSKTFEEIQALYEKVKRFDESFTAVGSTEDERRIKEMNEGVKDTDQKRLKEEDIEKVPAKVEVTEQGSKKRKGGHSKMIARKKPRKQLDDDSDDEHRKCLKIVTFEGTLDSEIMEKKICNC